MAQPSLDPRRGVIRTEPVDRPEVAAVPERTRRMRQLMRTAGAK